MSCVLKLPAVFAAIASADPSSAQCPGTLLPSCFGIQTIFFPFLTAPFASAATCPVMFTPAATSTFIATPPPANFSPGTALAATFFVPAETTIAYWLPFTAALFEINCTT